MDINKLVADELSKNYQINSFSKGMNSDTAYDQVDPSQYLFGQNIRITNNTVLLGDINENTKEQLVSPVPKGAGVSFVNSTIDGVDSILAAEAIENVGCIIVKNTNDNTWSIYKINYNPDDNTATPTLIYTSNNTVAEGVTKFSVTLIKEIEGVIKSYIADGVNPVMSVFLENNEINNLVTFYEGQTDRDLCSGQHFPYKKPILSEISGNLKTQQAQYTYRLYRRYGVTSKISPLTNKIQIIGTNKKIELGVAEDTVTDIGMRLTIPINSVQQKLFNYIQIFRISFIKPGQVPEVNLICDKKLDIDKTSNTFQFDDTGIQSLQKYSLEEFAALQTQTLIPKIIEQNQNYLFAANIKDETIIDAEAVSKFTEAVGSVYCNINIDNVGYDKLPEVTQTSNLSQVDIVDGSNDTVESVQTYLTDCGIAANIDKLSYENRFVSSLFRSLRRDEKYQYGVVYYDKYGNHSSVVPLKSVKTIDGVEHETDDFETITEHPFGTKGVSKVAGVKVTITPPNNYDGDIIGFQVVRREKSFDYTKNIVQVALSRPMRQGRFAQPSYRTPYYPNVFLSSQFFYTLFSDKLEALIWYGHTAYPGTARISDGEHHGLSKKLWSSASGDVTTNYHYFDNSGTNAENTSLYQIFSPEINIERSNVLSRISASNAKLFPVQFSYENRNLDESTTYFADRVHNNIVYPKVMCRILSDSVQDESQDATSYSEYDYGSQSVYCATVGNITYPDGITIGFDGFSIQTNSTYSQDAYLYIPSDIDFKFQIFDTINSHLLPGDWLDPQNFDDHNLNGNFINVGNREINNVYYDVYKFTLTGNYNVLIKTEDSHGKFPILYDYYGQIIGSGDANNVYTSELNQGDGKFSTTNHVYFVVKAKENYDKSEKVSQNAIIKLDTLQTFANNATEVAILNSADVKNPNWNDGFSNPTFDSQMNVNSIIKQYKSYSTSVGEYSYNNWVSNGMYDMAATQSERSTQLGNKDFEHGLWIFESDTSRYKDSLGWIGPGPVCLLVNIDAANLSATNVLKKQIDADGSDGYKLGTIVANIQHTPNDYTNLSPYYGFGNFFEFDKGQNGKIIATTKCVFDGEIYPMFAEFVNMFKTYDFNDKFATIPSGQVVYYIPLESKINTYFDYGCNYRNTQSANLMLEPGQITGVAAQSRPLHQYNMIYSDNDNSIDVFYTESEKKPQVEFPQRIAYSQLKTNGENIDNYQIFKPADFIDADSRYGDITELLSVDTNIYFWQTGAFGKLSVNERSLVTDNSGETIQLGQGGVLQRTDYLSTKYGMRKYDYSAISADSAIYWIDIVNKAILQYSSNVVNYGEALNVQNIINKGISNNIPTIAHDTQSNELLCGCLNTGQLVFNTKYNIPTSVYTRTYEDSISFANVLCGLHVNNNELEATRYNFLSTLGSLLSPTILSFVINGSPQQTKVFDNQKVVIAGKGFKSISDLNQLMPTYLQEEQSKLLTDYLKQKTYSFKTDIKSTNEKPMFRTDREGNIVYDIPRASNEIGYGDRMRGKWMVETITDFGPQPDYCISHIITKFRQSYS